MQTPGLPPMNNLHKIITIKHHPVLKQSDNQKLLKISIFAKVYLVDKRIIRKAPCSTREEDIKPVYPGHPALGYEKASYCLPRDYKIPNTILSDIFALGSILYKLQHHADFKKGVFTIAEQALA
ncbi:uncharacterized protein BJX67DRAFT_372804 [Aspergillus lucknowensis]|uniref:Protein kinase domain-containing protein n=1 Tax=Aspergillus lucknowensis TaxID=176173 RepID=A0ABR4LNN6_9EURO